MSRRLGPHAGSIRELLDRLVRAARGSSDAYERALDEVAAGAARLPVEGLLDSVEEAIGGSEERRAQTPVVLSHLTHVPEVWAEIESWVRGGDLATRVLWLRAIGERGLLDLAPLLNPSILDGDQPTCRLAAIQSAGDLLDPRNLPTLLERAGMEEPDDTWPLLVAFVRYGSESARPFLESHFLAEPVEVDIESAESHDELFADDRVEDNRLVAAWGLAKLGDERARAHLVDVLRDQEEEWTRRIRAAQALSELDGVGFEWGRDAVESALARLGG